MPKMLMALLGLVLWVPLAGSSDTMTANSPKRVLTVTEPVVVGSQTLKPGDYTFQCVIIEGREYLLVTSPHNGKEIARVPCEPKALGGKATASSYHSVPGPNGVAVLRSVQLKGDTVAHTVIVE